MTTAAPTTPHRSEPDAWVLRLIGAFRLFKAVLLIIVGVGAMHFRNIDLPGTVLNWLEYLHINPEQRFAQKLLFHITGITPKRLAELGVVALLYAALFSVEGVGLLMARRWAEWVSVISTSLLIPLELYETVRRFHVVRAVVLLVNVAIVVYLIQRIRAHGKWPPEKSSPGKDSAVTSKDVRADPKEAQANPPTST
jgi:uncharacterized membrane protein (DUF2068 family)